MSDEKALAIKNIKNDAERISSQLDGLCRSAHLPSPGIMSNLNNTIYSVNEVLPILAPVDENNPNTVNSRTRGTWTDLMTAWDKIYLEDKWEKQWNRGQICRDCAEKAKIFSSVVFALE